MKITEDFIGNETKELTKTKIATILRWWGFNPDSYSTWGNARVDMNNILSGSSSSTISDRERASSFLSKINYINDTDTVISDTLFAANEPGVWYDPSDFSTLFQDSAGTTPVTAVEQPVGLMLDKSKGLVLGPELVTNGTFDTDISGWTSGISSGGTIAWSDGTLLVTRIGGGTSAVHSFPVIEGRSYRITANSIFLSGTSSQSFVAIRNGNNTVTSGILAAQSGAVGNSFAFSFVFMAQNTATVYVHLGIALNTGQYTFDNISVRELPGNHASQTTATSRPVLSARYNLLTKTEQFDDAAWGKSNATVTANAVVAPDGTQTGEKLVEAVSASTKETSSPIISITTGTAYTVSIYAKAAERSRLRIAFNGTVFPGGNSDIFDLANGTVVSQGANSVARIVAVSNGWYRCSVTQTSNGSGTTRSNFFSLLDTSNSASYTGDGTSGIYIWGADLRVANDGANLPPYQRVNTATDYDTVGFPHYLRFDGVDDWLVTNTITPGTDKVQVFAGVRKLSDASAGIVMELSSSLVNAGTFNLFAPRGNPVGTGNYGFQSHGSTQSNAQTGNAYAAPLSSILTGLGDISGDAATLRVNGAVAATSNTDQGTGNYVNYPLYIGRRGGTTLPFNGRLYSLIVRFGYNLPAATIEKTEKYINGLTKAY